MTKYLRLYNKAGTLLKSSGNIEGSTGTIKIENLFPETIYHSGDFLVSWVINGEELNRIPVPEFKTLSGNVDKTIIVYFSDINDENLVSLKGDSAYKIAIDNGFNGSQKEWLESLKGEPGEPGRQGDPGRDGVDITEGGSAYEIALAEGFQGTREEWLGSLKGEPGRQGEKGDPGEDGFGVDGASAYEIALENGFVGNIQDFLDSLVGEPGKDGQDGNDGLSAYQIALENGYTGTESEWLESLNIDVEVAKDYTDSKLISIDDKIAYARTRSFRDIKIHADLPAVFEGYQALLEGTSSNHIYPQGLAVDSDYLYVLYSYDDKSPGKEKILIVYARKDGYRQHSMYTLSNVASESIEIEYTYYGRYLYAKSGTDQLGKYDLSDLTGIPNTPTRLEPMQTYDIPVLYQFARFKNGWIFELANNSKGYYNQRDTFGLYNKNLSEKTSYFTTHASIGNLWSNSLTTKSSKRQGLTVFNNNILQAVGGNYNVGDDVGTYHLQGIQELSPSGEIINDYTYDPNELADFLGSQGKDVNRIEHEGLYTDKEYDKNNVYSIIIYNTTISREDSNENGLLFVEYRPYEPDHTFKQLGKPFLTSNSLYNPYKKVVSNKLVNDYTGKSIDSLKELALYMIDSYQDKVVFYSSWVDILDLSNVKIENGIKVTLENLDNKVFYLSYEDNFGVVKKKLTVNKSQETITIIDTRKEKSITGTDLLTLDYNTSFYSIGSVNSPSGVHVNGFVKCYVSDNNRILTYEPFNSNDTFKNIYNSGSWKGWKNSNVNIDTIVAQKHVITQDNGDRLRVSDVDPITLNTGYYQIWKMKNSPVGFDSNAQYWNVDIITAQDNVKQIKATLSATGQEYTRTIHKGNDLGWKFINNEKYGRNDFKLYTIPLMAPFNTANLSVMENNHIVTVRLQGKANSNTNNISDLDVVIGKLPAHIEYPKDFVRCTISSMTKGETEQFIGNLVIDTKGIITVKFNRSGTSNSYFGGSLSFPKGDNKNVAFNSTNTKVYDYPDPNVVSVQGSDYYDGYIFGAITRTKGNVTEIQVIDTNNTSSSFICTNQQENFSTLVGHGNSLKVVDKLNDEYLMYITMTDDPKIVPVFVNTTTKIARVGEGIKTMQDSGGSEKRIISIDRVDKVGSTYELYCLWYGIEFKYTISNINTVESLKGEQVFKLPLERVIEDKKMLLNDDSNSIKVYQDNLLDGDTFYITQYGENSSAILEYRVENAMAKSTGKYWYNYRTDAERYEIESIFKINGELYASISQKLFNKSTYDTYVIKVTLNT
ncbi:glycerophosphoryl diester phosphodiesterase [Staphylococcus phage PG-2021_15]